MINPTYKHIENYIQPKAKVLDLGCESGELLSQLQQDKQVKGYGIEKELPNILTCIERGINVFQGDIEEGLLEFSDASFDVAILSQTLQEIQKPLVVITEMLRVANIAIVTFPNFAYWKIRLHLLKGKAPITANLPFSWYETPNIRLITIQDFKDLCAKKHIHIRDERSIGPNTINLKRKPSNLLSMGGLFVLTKK